MHQDSRRFLTLNSESAVDVVTSAELTVAVSLKSHIGGKHFQFVIY